MTGSYGSLGILTQLTFRTYAAAEASQTLVLVGKPEAIVQVSAPLRNSVLTPWAMDWLSPDLLNQVVSLDMNSPNPTPPTTPFNTGTDMAIGLAIQFQSMPTGIDAQVAQCHHLAQTTGLAVQSLQDEAEQEFWRRLSQVLCPGPATGATATGGSVPPAPEAVNPMAVCKIGVLPGSAVTVLQTLQEWSQAQEFQLFGRIHASSGLGMVQLQGGISAPLITQIRQLCQNHGGYLSILQAPQTLKQQVDVWGYTGNALGLMQRLKQQFDTHRILSPGRFVGGI